jgi:hypothetical protein
VPNVNFRKPCARKGCEGIVRRPDSIYCSRRCGFDERIAARQRSKVANTRMFAKPLPKVKAKPAVAVQSDGSWWCDYSAFYSEARKRFPEDAGDKCHLPVQTFGGYERGLMAVGRERLKDRRDREELRG